MGFRQAGGSGTYLAIVGAGRWIGERGMVEPPRKKGYPVEALRRRETLRSGSGKG